MQQCNRNGGEVEGKEGVKVGGIKESESAIESQSALQLYRG